MRSFVTFHIHVFFTDKNQKPISQQEKPRLA